MNDARFGRMRWPWTMTIPRLFRRWCAARGYFYETSNPLCNVYYQRGFDPSRDIATHYFRADYGVPSA